MGHGVSKFKLGWKFEFIFLILSLELKHVSPLLKTTVAVSRLATDSEANLKKQSLIIR